MERKNRKKIIVINLFLFALLFGLVSLNKEFIRPLFCQISFLKILTGCFPNFIVAYIISIYLVNAVVINEPKHSRFIVYIGSFLVFVILTVEELKPMWEVSTYYDSFDILASGVGALLSILTFEIIVWKKKSKI